MTIIRTDKRLRPRSKSDYYPTPSEAARAALNLIDMDKVAYVLDPGAGNGVWGTELKKINKYAYLYGVEIQNLVPLKSVYDSWDTVDFLSWNNRFFTFDLIMGNPPYSLAEEFVRHSYSMLGKRGKILYPLLIVLSSVCLIFLD